MSTVLDLIKDSLREIHVLGRGQSLTAEESQTALTILNDLIGSWSVEGGLIFTETKETFNATGAASYTIGSGGDFNTTRPVRLLAAYATLGTIDYPLELIDDQQYAQIADKTTTGTPASVYNDGNYPLSRLYFNPLPTAGYTLTLMSEKELTSYASLATSVTLPPGYRRALRLNLAVELASHYEKEPGMTLAKNAREAKDAVFAANSSNEKDVLSSDPAIVISDSFNIYNGEA